MLPDFPTTAIEFNEVFSSEEACVAYLESVRWPDGFVCPKRAPTSASAARNAIACS